MLGSTTDFSVIVRLIEWSAAAIFVLSVLLVVRAAQLRKDAQKREKELSVLRAEWRAIFNGPPQWRKKLPSIRRDNTLAWLLLWNQAQEAAQGTDSAHARMRMHLNEIAMASGMPAGALRWLHRRDVVERLQAITLLGHVRDASAVPALRRLCKSPNALLSIAAARALLQIDDISFCTAFVDLMAERADWPPGKLVTIVQQEHAIIGDALLAVCCTAPEAITRRLMRYLRYLPGSMALPAVCSVLDTAADPETLTAALKALTDIGTDTAPMLAARLAGYNDWRVRVQAANALGALGDDSHVPLLTAMLEDRHWWVRYRAAQALAAIAARGQADLEQLLSVQTDRFAREALAQAIAERAPLMEGAVAS